MSEETFVPFSEYLKNLTGGGSKKAIQEKPRDQIMSELDEVRKQFK